MTVRELIQHLMSRDLDKEVRHESGDGGYFTDEPIDEVSEYEDYVIIKGYVG